MKVTLNRANFLSALKATSRIIHVNKVGILNNIHLKAKDTSLWLGATNLEAAVIDEVDAVVVGKGETTLPASRLIGILESMVEDQITLLVDEKDEATITSETSKSRVKGRPAVEYPNVEIAVVSEKISVEARLLLRAVTRVIFALPREYTGLVALDGVMFRVDKESLTTAASNRNLMADYTIPVETKLEEALEIVVSGTNIREAIRLLNVDGKAEMTYDKKTIAIQVGRSAIKLGLINAVFPRYEHFYTQPVNHKATVRADELTSALRNAMIFARDMADFVKLSFSEKLVTVEGTSMETGEARREVKASLQGEPIKIGVNGKYLLEAVAAMEGDMITINTEGQGKPIIILPVAGAGRVFMASMKGHET